LIKIGVVVQALFPLPVILHTISYLPDNVVQFHFVYLI